MANLRDIRNRIGSVNNTQQITKAMKMVAAAKLRKAQEQMVQTRPYAAKIQDIVGKLVKGSDVSNKLMHVDEDVSSVLMIIVGSDRGLCGGFNNNLFKEVEKEIEKRFQSFRDKNKLGLITIGKKATAHFSKRNYSITSSHPGFFDNLEYDTTSEIMTSAIHSFLADEYDEVYIAYNEFRSVIDQNRKIEKLLPIDPRNLEGDETFASIDYIYEPDSSEILDQILPLHLNTQLWKAVLESNASEMGARMTAMDKATDNAGELIKSLRLQYNRSRQAAITTEILEIVAGAEALAQGK